MDTKETNEKNLQRDRQGWLIENYASILIGKKTEEEVIRILIKETNYMTLERLELFLYETSQFYIVDFIYSSFIENKTEWYE